ncbi:MULTISPECIES: hypothetical protein [Burkholderia]|uniref:Uncharacterized protein n=1 Tax=Burkholderia contaminans TaxID=488447 RepID=A0AAP1V590_9BURK|nr:MULTISPECIES: hypothetical protein [Burkholderia]MBK1902022.1 hypothetical protein [Burkholderia contaminans]MBK1910305.1 hypothetical protein [Burkholderia contaminans]MBK1923764.1 hypothetical protein [Burkholderia contaminans]MBK1931976.1 hypothetical protein [Burkholderia contaminans]MBK1939225.1 hypothetical protein [Burkholderia contaminans]
MLEMLLLASIPVLPLIYVTAWVLGKISRRHDPRPMVRRKLDRNWPWN